MTENKSQEAVQLATVSEQLCEVYNEVGIKFAVDFAKMHRITFGLLEIILSKARIDYDSNALEQLYFKPATVRVSDNKYPKYM